MAGMSSDDDPRLATAARRPALEAGQTVMTFYRTGTTVKTTDDRSPVTDADPHAPVISEESTGAGSALKFGLIARGAADVYPRFGPTMEWDTAAGQAILAAAGGHVRDLSGQELRYGKAGFVNPSFVASGAS